MSAESVVSVITPLFALLIGYLWFRAMQQTRIVSDLRASVAELQKDLAARRAQEAAANTISPEVEAAATLSTPTPKRKRTRKR